MDAILVLVLVLVLLLSCGTVVENERMEGGASRRAKWDESGRQDRVKDVRSEEAMVSGCLPFEEGCKVVVRG